MAFIIQYFLVTNSLVTFVKKQLNVSSFVFRFRVPVQQISIIIYYRIKISGEGITNQV